MCALGGHPAYAELSCSNSALREEFLQGMTWLHLVALPGSGQETKASLKSRLELLWWKAESGISTEQDVDTAQETDADIGLSSNNHNFLLRRHVARAFRGSSKGSSPLLEDKEAIFQYLKQTYASSTQTLPSLSDVRSMAALSDVLKIKSDLEKTYEYELKSAAKRVKRAFASDGRNWTEIPLSHVPSETWREHPEDAGIFEELQQAREQLRAVRLKAIDLGEAGSLFNLRNLGLLLE